MASKITKKDGYKCAPDGHTVITIPCGTIVDGRIEDWAILDGAASRMLKRGRKSKKDMGAAPENK